VRGSNFYITILAYLTDVAQSLEFISNKSYKHVNNQHLKLKYNQIKDIQQIFTELELLNKEIIEVFESKKLDRIAMIFPKQDSIRASIKEKIKSQIERTRTEESSPKNTTLYFNILLEVKDLNTSIFNLIDEYYSSFKK
jgi:Na+/phosphate symporter